MLLPPGLHRSALRAGAVLHVKLLGPGKTFCAHAPGAMGPLESGLKYFRDELAALIPPDAETLELTQPANAASNN